MNDDDLEQRLRGALTRSRADDAVNTDDFLDRVHHGAKVRRVKRGVSLAAASALAVAGGGFALDASGLLGGSKSPVAAKHTPFNTFGTESTGTRSTGTGPPTSTTPSQTKESSATPSTEPRTVVISPNGPIAGSDVHPVSLTATGTDHQWVLAKTPGDDCGLAECATVFSTPDHAGNWTDLGQLPAPPATSDTAGPDTVSQLRFTKRTDGSEIYDGWAYGNALWSTHDSGKTWSNEQVPAGSVTQLESWGDFVYAGVSNSALGADTANLYRSPATVDAWEPIKVSPKGLDGLTSVQALAASQNVLGLIDSGSGLHPVLYVSTDGTDWQREKPCPQGTDAAALSTASDSGGTVSSLWVTCQGLSGTVIVYTDTRSLGTWNKVPDDSFPPAVMVAAQSSTLAFVAGDGVPGLQRVSTTEPATTVSAVGVGPPTFFGFTDVSHGYLLDADGNILSTINGGGEWLPYAVTDTP